MMISFGGVLRLKEILEKDGIEKLILIAPEWNEDIESLKNRLREKEAGLISESGLSVEAAIQICEKIQRAIKICLEAKDDSR